MAIELENTHFHFIPPRFHFGQKLKTKDSIGIICGIVLVGEDSQQWEYTLMEEVDGEFTPGHAFSFGELELTDLQ